MSVFNNYLKQFNIILFEQSRFLNLALMRVVLCGTLLYMDIWRHLVVYFFGPDSILPRSEALSVYPEFYRPVLTYFFWPDAWASKMHLILIGLLFLATIGLSNRLLLFLTWVIYQGFLHRNFSVHFGADMIGGLFLFYLSFTRCFEHFTVKKWFFKKNSDPVFDSNRFGDQVSSVFFRLMQIQISVIYMYTGFEKLKGSTWWDGTALWTVFANPQFAVFDMLWLKNFPLFFAIGTFTTLIFEIYFPVLVYFQKTRLLWLALGVLFHFMIGFFIGLMPFSLVMISTYLLFLSRSNLRQLKLIK